jgi:septal ring factor EnvC (AmiA/AmiB activator)
MPRGTSRPPEIVLGELEAKKSSYQTKIDNYKSKISQLDSKISSLHTNQRQKEVERILEAVKQSGRTVDDFITSFLDTAKLGMPGS